MENQFDRTLKHSDSIKNALKIAILAFDSTRISTSEVDYPLDVVIYQKNKHKMSEYRLNEEDLYEIASWWQERLRSSVNEIPARKLDEILLNIGM